MAAVHFLLLRFCLLFFIIVFWQFVFYYRVFSFFFSCCVSGRLLVEKRERLDLFFFFDTLYMVEKKKPLRAVFGELNAIVETKFLNMFAGAWFANMTAYDNSHCKELSSPAKTAVILPELSWSKLKTKPWAADNPNGK